MAVTAGVMLCTGCGPGAGTVKVALANGNPRALTSSSQQALTGTSGAPSTFAVKLAAIYLVEDQAGATAEGDWLGENVGNAIRVWTNPACGAELSDEGCASAGYFDLNRTSAEVNASLNAQAAQAEPGNYRYIKVALLGSQQKSNSTYVNTKWADATSSTPDQEFASVQTEWGVPFSSPLVLAAGDSVTATLTYDLSAIVYRDSTAEEKVPSQGKFQPSKADDCAGAAGAPRTCIEFPALTASASKATN
ncbi:MAG: hypothetical protein FJ086_16840 [Deltaproteobacteria bacterium]|nr:hypothetical protein [Deltaproteobacteria bacterium]